VEKAVCCNGVITAFCLRNTQFTELACEPLDTCLCVQSSDFGKTWSEPVEFSKYQGRIYDACVHDGVIYVLQFCNPVFETERPDDYKLFASYDNGKSFLEVSSVEIDSRGHIYGALQFTTDGRLLAFANDHKDSYNLSVCESSDLGRTWRKLPDIRLSEGIRNVQMSRLGNGYVMHGRACRGLTWGKGFVFYSSQDGINWDDGILLEEEKQCCYYSNNLLLTMPDGKERLLVQYSDLYPCEYANSVNVMHLFAEIK
jgi:hypothetical protein